MNRIAQFAVPLAAAVLALPALAQFAKTDDAVKYRQSVMFVQSQHFGRIGAMANGRAPYDAASAAANAEVVAAMARLPWPAFGPGTEGGKAKADVWKEEAKFKELGDRLVSDTGKLLEVARTNNLDALKAQFGATADTCKSCHDAYRNR